MAEGREGRKGGEGTGRKGEERGRRRRGVPLLCLPVPLQLAVAGDATGYSLGLETERFPSVSLLTTATAEVKVQCT